MKTIGQFAKENNVTIKTLHHYEKMELINPSKKDDETGYRYYGESEARDLRIVLFLKELGLSLSEIKKVIGNEFSNQSLRDFLLFKKNQSEQDKESVLTRLHKLNRVVNMLESNAKDKLDIKELIDMGKEELFTGKYGRGKFIEESEKLFDKAKENKTKLSVVQLDLDMFHKLNQTYGYDIGDIVLERTQDEIVSILQECSYETLLERRGGDEFSITVCASTREASMLSTKILNRVKDVDYSDVADKLKVYITAGISGLTKKSESYTQLVHEATMELYKAKRNKR